jgi:glycosyltransferase involved in cell wall biosynthesis
MSTSKINIHLITHLTGFPYGTAAANRILMLGKALLNSGCFFKVYTNNIFVNTLSNDSQGIFEGIPFVNLHGATRLKNNKLIRSFLFLKGLIKLFPIIKRMNPKDDVVYIYAQGYAIIFNLIVLIICRWFGIKVVQEVNEWYHNDLNRKVEKYFTEGPILKLSTGAIVISENINSIVCKINSNLKTIVIPILGEPFNEEQSPNEKSVDRYCFWMGLVDGYIEDVIFIAKACGIAYQKGYRFEFAIAGSYKHESMKRIFNESSQYGFPKQNIHMLGYVSETELRKYCLNAYFYIIPLWDTERSSSRFPTKMASFMFSGKPLISCKIGASGKMLNDGENVLFYKPGDMQDLSEKIEIIFKNKAIYDKLCINSYKFAMQNFLYKNYSNPLIQYFKNIVAD